MTRIIGGTVGGRRLQTPPGEGTRPTSDRVREALFSALESQLGSLHDLRVLDLYAGSGALGLEAWSRGAADVLLVEQDRRTADLIRRNARDLGCTVAQVRAVQVAAVLREPAPVAFDLVFSDPPYPLPNDAVEGDLAALVAGGWLGPDALVILERGRRSGGPNWPPGLVGVREKRYGETTLWYGRAAAPEGLTDAAQEEV